MADETLFQLLHTEVVAAAYGGGRGSGDEGQRTGLTVLEGMGFRVGQGLAERLPRGALVFREELDTIKFLCRDLWGAVFRKQTDNLRTNHQSALHGFTAIPGILGNNYPIIQMRKRRLLEGKDCGDVEAKTMDFCCWGV
uniref:Trafficking protein particle complex subunit 6A isoform X4 n=1 Tax=Phascolarctos cinereus TaxID=38626 RepID=A0A6P5LPU8_PHACI|nr:trafficking protein particle complex subunit 6A isoform X4 [Phascolarctos cinereus]